MKNKDIKTHYSYTNETPLRIEYLSYINKKKQTEPENEFNIDEFITIDVDKKIPGMLEFYALIKILSLNEQLIIQEIVNKVFNMPIAIDLNDVVRLQLICKIAPRLFGNEFFIKKAIEVNDSDTINIILFKADSWVKNILYEFIMNSYSKDDILYFCTFGHGLSIYINKKLLGVE